MTKKIKSNNSFIGRMKYYGFKRSNNFLYIFKNYSIFCMYIPAVQIYQKKKDKIDIITLSYILLIYKIII